MQLNEYQQSIPQFAVYPEAGTGGFAEINYLVLGLASEAGEVAGKWKKYVRDGVLNEEAFLSELGDCYWYLTQLCSAAGVTAESVLKYNYAKLSKRKETNTIQGSGDKREEEAVAPSCGC